MSNVYHQQILAAHPNFQAEKYNQWGARNGYYTEDTTPCYEASAEDSIKNAK